MELTAFSSSSSLKSSDKLEDSDDEDENDEDDDDEDDDEEDEDEAGVRRSNSGKRDRKCDKREYVASIIPPPLPVPRTNTLG